MSQPHLLSANNQVPPASAARSAKRAYPLLTLEAGILCGVMALALALRLWHLAALTDNYDEGVYLASLRAMRSGGALFTQVFSSQPPLFLLSLYPFVWLFGPTMLAARSGVVFFSLIGLLAMYLLARRLGGPWAGAAAALLLACDHLFLIQSQSLEAEVPSIALMIAAVAAAVYVDRAPWQASALSGVFTSLALLEKLLFPLAAIAAIALLFLGHLSVFERGQQTQMLSDPAGSGRITRYLPHWQTIRRAAMLGGAYLLSLLLVVVLVFLPYLGHLPAAYQQIVSFHLAAGQSFPTSVSQNWQILSGNFGQDMPLVLLSFLGMIAGLLRRRWAVLIGGAWTLVALVILLRQTPLFPHHLVLLIPGLALTAALGLMPAPATIASDMTAFRQRLRPLLLSLSGQSTRLVLVWLPALLVVGVLALNLRANLDQPLGMPAANAARLSQVASDLRLLTTPQQSVITDDQYIATLAGRDVPPELVDTSTVRITTGYLTTAQVITIAEQPQVGAILFYSGRFQALPGFSDWVAQHFHLARTYGPEQALYLKDAPIP
ncbi:MAG TPA: glycosyltransferase family 39 protein [Ktedonobacterales bacterium]|nr:glycosyltransferase family 39 protein [Ktedonobacterales bacterium]